MQWKMICFNLFTDSMLFYIKLISCDDRDHFISKTIAPPIFRF